MQVGTVLISIQSLVLLIVSLSLVHINQKKVSLAVNLSVISVIIGSVLTLLTLALGIDNVFVFSKSLYLNNSGLWLAFAAEIATLIVILGSKEHIRNWSSYQSFLSLSLLLLLGTIYLALAANILIIITGWALASAASYAISMISKDIKSVEGGLKYLIMGIVSSSIMLFGFAFYVPGIDTFNLVDPSPVINSFVLIGISLLSIAFMFKIGNFPFHAWLPDVYSENDRIVIAMISSVGKIIGVASLLKVIEFLTLNNLDKMLLLSIFSLVAIASMFFGNFVAFSRRRITSILAYSSIAQMGFVMIGFAMIGTPLESIAIAGIVIQVIAYSIAQSGLFLLANYVERVMGSVELSSLNGLSANRWLAFSSSILFLSLLGIPPLAGFWGKVFLFESSIYYPWLLVLGVINSAISAGYYLIVVREMFRQGDFEFKKSDEIDGIYLATILTIVIGLLSPIIFFTIV
ncbi:NADH-quinone oxidoreductase subunit N [Sulfolobales archaeon HS-7]|nr:NADH-quinone oxidoreductase subunit N [Sulfolobales archaeon HS-7]